MEDEHAPNQLIVEGQDDRQSVVELMRAHIPGWPQRGKANAPVRIRIGNSASEILAAGYLEANLKSSPLRILGVMLDADGGVKPGDRYNSFRQQCQGMFPMLPRHLPRTGLIADHADKRLGLWVMPDNSSEGGLEAFLKHFVPPEASRLWSHAVNGCIEARSCGSLYRDSQLDKAHMYSFLAWQDPPGQSPGNAISRDVLDPHSPNAAPFLSWFRALYAI